MAEQRPGARLKGKVIWITGAGRGIGRSIALTCAKRGADLLLSGRSAEELDTVARQVEALGRRAIVANLDLRDEQSPDDCLTRGHEGFGQIDVLIANSGVGGPTAPVWATATSDWNDTFTVNVTGTFLCARAVLPEMIERRKGNIVVIGSMTGKRPLAHRAAYAASKMALVGFVRTAAAELGPHGVRINLVSPGAVAGERLESVVRSLSTEWGLSEEETKAKVLDGTPLDRTVDPSEVASAVAFLASDDASAITGEDLNVSAGTVTY